MFIIRPHAIVGVTLREAKCGHVEVSCWWEIRLIALYVEEREMKRRNSREGKGEGRKVREEGEVKKWVSTRLHVRIVRFVSILACGGHPETAQGARPYQHVPHSNVLVAVEGVWGRAAERARGGQPVARVARPGAVVQAVLYDLSAQVGCVVGGFAVQAEIAGEGGW
jgi:hypothetical protein